MMPHTKMLSFHTSFRPSVRAVQLGRKTQQLPPLGEFNGDDSLRSGCNVSCANGGGRPPAYPTEGLL